MTEEDEKRYRQTNICRFCEKETFPDKVRYQFHLTGKNRGPAHNKCKTNVKQKQSSFIPFAFHIFLTYECHLFVKNLVDKKNDKIKFRYYT